MDEFFQEQSLTEIDHRFVAKYFTYKHVGEVMERKKVGSYLERPQRLVTDAPRAQATVVLGSTSWCKVLVSSVFTAREAAWLSTGVLHEPDEMQTPAQVPVLVMPPESNLQHSVTSRSQAMGVGT